MSESLFDTFFQNEARMFLMAGVRVALSEDGPDLTSEGIFKEEDILQAQIVARQSTMVAGLPIIPIVLEFMGEGCQHFLNADDGDRVSEGTAVAMLQGPAAKILKAERVILNYICHLSGIAELTSKYVAALDDSETVLLDTRKTLPGLRYAEKYAVRVGGAQNHRMNLTEMLMLKDNHIDHAGSIKNAVETLRNTWDPCPKIEVECRNLDEIREAVIARADRIMFDNMSVEDMTEAVRMIDHACETEISGNVTLENVAELGRIGADYISVGRLTHSAPASDFSMNVIPVK